MVVRVLSFFWNSPSDFGAWFGYLASWLYDGSERAI